LKKYVYLAALIICFGWSDGYSFTPIQFTKPQSLAPQVQTDRWECLAQVRNLPTHSFYGWKFTRLSLDIPPDIENPPVIGDETTVPEPTTIVLMLVGSALLVLFLKENK
jgi:hypothetical protein